MAYPTDLDTFTDPASSDTLNSPSHSTQHANVNTAVEELEKKVGTGASNASSATNGQVLVADGSGGTAWGNGASAPSESVGVPLTASNYFAGEGATATKSFSLNLMVVGPLYVARAATLTRIGCRVTTAGSTGALQRLVIYSDNGDGRPGDLLLDAGTIDATTTGAKEITISQAITPGLYWLGAVPQGATSTIRTRRDIGLMGHTDLDTVLQNDLVGYTQSSVSGAAPASFTVGGVDTDAPKIAIGAI